MERQINYILYIIYNYILNYQRFSTAYKQMENQLFGTIINPMRYFINTDEKVGPD